MCDTLLEENFIVKTSSFGIYGLVVGKFLDLSAKKIANGKRAPALVERS